MKTLIIWGTGAHAGSLLASLKRLPCLPFTEVVCISDLPEMPAHWQGLRVLGNRNVLQTLSLSEYAVFPAVGLPHLRRCLHQHLDALGFQIPSIVDPSAIIEPGVSIGPGCFVRAYCVIGYEAQVAEGVLLNSGAHISHNSQIGAYASLFPGARTLGHSVLETGVLLGANAVVAPGCRVGAWSRVSMASAVLEDMPSHATVRGNPATVLRQYAGPPPAQLLPLRA